VHIPKWFKESINTETKEKEYEYLGGYWEAKEKGNFGEVLDLF